MGQPIDPPSVERTSIGDGNDLMVSVPTVSVPRPRRATVQRLAQMFGRGAVVLVLATATLAPNAMLPTSSQLMAQSNPPAAPGGPGSGPPAISRPTPVPNAWTGIGTVDDALAGIGNWIDRANREYRDIVERELSVPTEAAREAERRRANPESPAPSGAPSAAPSGGPQQIARPAEQSKPAEATPADTAALPPTDDATRARQRAAEADRLKGLATTPPKQADAPIAPAPPIAAVPQVAAKPDEAKRDEARQIAERKEAERREAERKLTERREAERKEAERVAADKRDLERKAVERREAERKEAERVAADKREAARKAADSKPAAPSATEPAAVARPPTPGQLADDATKAGTAILQRLERERSSAPSSDRADGTAVTESPQRTRTAEAGTSRCKAAGRKVDPPGTYVVKRGDTLWRISRVHYDRGARYMRIVRANASKITDPDLIYPCQRFFLPEARRAATLIDLPRDVVTGLGQAKPNGWPMPVTSAAGASFTGLWPSGSPTAGLSPARLAGPVRVRP